MLRQNSIWLDRPHFLKPADKVGEEAFAVIRQAMVATGTAALSRLVLYRREHAVVLMPRDKGHRALDSRLPEARR